MQEISRDPKHEGMLDEFSHAWADSKLVGCHGGQTMCYPNWHDENRGPVVLNFSCTQLLPISYEITTVSIEPLKNPPYL
jgi:hypothetical protein